MSESWHKKNASYMHLVTLNQQKYYIIYNKYGKVINLIIINGLNH